MCPTYANVFHFSQLVQKISKIIEVTSSLQGWVQLDLIDKKQQTQTKSVRQPNWPKVPNPWASSLKHRKLGVSVLASWPQPIPVLLYFCWQCYFSMENPHSIFCNCAKIAVHAELHVNQLLFASLWFFLSRCSPCVPITDPSGLQAFWKLSSFLDASHYIWSISALYFWTYWKCYIFGYMI